MRSLRSKLAATLSAFCALASNASGAETAAEAVNRLGVDLYRQISTKPGNICISPYSINAALTMTLLGAEGETRREMARVLHWQETADAGAAFAALRAALAETVTRTEKGKDSSEPIVLAVANRLFLQEGFALRTQFLARVKESFGAPPEPLDFQKNTAAATRRINEWVEGETRTRIRDLIPGPLPAETRLVLANAVYLKAPWAEAFVAQATKPEPFHVAGGAPVEVPMMRAVRSFGYAKEKGYTAVTLPYIGGELQFVILFPDSADGLAELEKSMTAQTWSACARLSRAQVDLRMPKFKFEPPTVSLADELQSLGMKMAFDIPPGSANFERMAQPKTGEALAISGVFHKTFIEVEEKGTEAAAATLAVTVYSASVIGEKPKPIEVKVNRPFLYAIQHVLSGACLFLGRVSDPR